MTGKPTPTPWAIFKAGIGEENGDGIASLWREGEEREANAALIVRAVNAHEALVKALELIIADYSGWIISRSTGNPETEQVYAQRVALAISQAEPALALALAGEAP